MCRSLRYLSLSAVVERRFWKKCHSRDWEAMGKGAEGGKKRHWTQCFWADGIHLQNAGVTAEPEKVHLKMLQPSASCEVPSAIGLQPTRALVVSLSIVSGGSCSCTDWLRWVAALACSPPTNLTALARPATCPAHLHSALAARGLFLADVGPMGCRTA